MPDRKKRKPMKLIIGDPVTSTDSFVKEQTIKLDPKAGERGKGLGSKPGAGVKIGARPQKAQRGRLHRKATRRATQTIR